ncbi:MAG: transposase, partial [Lachnospiraceae bacterium]|nr:transposase [Lachnospiraceae bacterium]
MSDYRINVFEIAWLREEQVKLFRSDFKIVADYFVQMRKNNHYIPSEETILHVDEVLKMMAV